MNEVKEQLKSVQSENHVISHLLNYPKSYLGIKGIITTKISQVITTGKYLNQLVLFLNPKTRSQSFLFVKN